MWTSTAGTSKTARGGIERLSAEVGDEVRVADVLMRLCKISVDLRQRESASRLLGAARAIDNAYDMALVGPLRSAYEELITSICALLREEGRSMPSDEAVQYALATGGTTHGRG